MPENKKRTSRAKLVPAMSLRAERSNLPAKGDSSGMGIPGSESGAGLPVIQRRQAGSLSHRPRNDNSAEKILHEPPETVDSFDSSFLAEFRENLASALTPSSAVDLITKLMAEAPAASKEELERIKVLDKLLNTARALMESRLKIDEAAAISARLDELEARIEKVAEELATGREDEGERNASGETFFV